MSKEKKILIGAHMSIAGGLEKALIRGESVGCTAIQIFTKNNKAYFGKIITEQDVERFKKQWKESSIIYVMTHCSYLVNIGAKNKETEKKSIAALAHELERCEVLGIPHLVIHPGSHIGAGEEKCITQIAHNLDTVFKKAPDSSMILLETAAGQGTNVGYTFEQLRSIYDQCKEKDRLGICLDTCHAFAAGYDIATKEGYKKMWDDFKKIIGIRKLKAIHLNGSKMPCGSRRDRHENLGKGEIPLETFKWIMNDPSLTSIPKILETPSVDGITE